MNFSKAKTPGPYRIAGLAVLILSALFLGAFAVAAEPGGVATTARVFLPTVLQPAFAIRNANFEAGRTGWVDTSTDGGAVIRTDQPVAAHSGVWVAWLGGARNNISTISQQVTVPASAPILSYYHYIASADACGYGNHRELLGHRPPAQHDIRPVHTGNRRGAAGGERGFKWSCHHDISLRWQHDPCRAFGCCICTLRHPPA